MTTSTPTTWIEDGFWMFDDSRVTAEHDGPMDQPHNTRIIYSGDHTPIEASAGQWHPCLDCKDTLMLAQAAEAGE